jgi:squalene-hopene/tetraprenyl-beta-curcumene cyclase
MAWPAAARDHGTFCISCHTAMPYALARPALRKALGVESVSPNERKLLENVTKRVRLWKDARPFYGEESGSHKSAQSRGTEAILNALILASYDARNGKLSDDAHTAFDHMWALQLTKGEDKGAWPWLNFDNAPFEAGDSVYYGACLAAIAVGTATENYRATPAIQANLDLLRDYIQRSSATQSLINQAVALWAASKLPGFMPRDQQQSIINEVLSQQRADGGWSLSSLAWTWRSSSLRSLAKLWLASEESPLDVKSDGYATGLITLALEQNRFPRSDPHLQRGLDWLARNQSQSEGGWSGYSLNHHRPHHFMSDAATAYAVLALTGSSSP